MISLGGSPKRRSACAAAQRAMLLGYAPAGLAVSSLGSGCAGVAPCGNLNSGWGETSKYFCWQGAKPPVLSAALGLQNPYYPSWNSTQLADGNLHGQNSSWVYFTLPIGTNQPHCCPQALGPTMSLLELVNTVGLTLLDAV